MLEFGYRLLGFIGAMVFVMFVLGILLWWGIVIYRFVAGRVNNGLDCRRY